jgi:hypothetical protein
MPQSAPVGIIAPVGSSALQAPITLQADGGRVTVGAPGGPVVWANPYAPIVPLLAGSTPRNMVQTKPSGK